MTLAVRVEIPSVEGKFVVNLDDEYSSAILYQQHGDFDYHVAIHIASWFCLLADSPLSDLKPEAALKRFLRNCLFRLPEVIARYAVLAHRLTKSEAALEPGALTSAGDSLVDLPVYREYIKEMEQTPVFREYLHFYRTGDSRSFSYVYTFLSFLKKMSYERGDLEQVAFRDWLGIEERLSRLTLPDFTGNLKVILDFIFRDWVFTAFIPKHGGGAVSERGVHGIMEKSMNFRMDKRVEYLYFRSPLAPLSESYSYPAGSSRECTSVDIARLKFVPKDYKSVRSICMEPIVLQWSQQGVRFEYEHWLSESILRNHVVLRDQGVNQRAALFGSETNRVDTIDLSSASDSVAWSLVKATFPAKVLKHLAATRSKRVETPSGELHNLVKFAPMGSALCFPVQSTLYAAICLMIGIAQTYNRNWREPNAFEGLDLEKAYNNSFFKSSSLGTTKYSPFFCYGDDIITDKSMTSSVVDCLQLLGFKVNESKSYFRDDTFRESCGKHYLRGFDVTPMTLKVPKIGRSNNIEVLAGVVDACNNADEFGFSTLRTFLIMASLYLKVYGVNSPRNPILFTEDGKGLSIRSANPKNKHLVTRFNEGYQVREFSHVQIGPAGWIPSDVFDGYHLTQWWRSRYRGTLEHEELPRGASKADPVGNRATMGWTPL